MSYRNPESKVPKWIPYVGLAILAIAALAMTAYVLSMSSGPTFLPSSVSPNAK